MITSSNPVRVYLLGKFDVNREERFLRIEDWPKNVAWWLESDQPASPKQIAVWLKQLSMANINVSLERDEKVTDRL